MRGEALMECASLVFGFGPACLAASIVGFLHGAFQPQLDQMQHTSVHDVPRERQPCIPVDAASASRRRIQRPPLPNDCLQPEVTALAAGTNGRSWPEAALLQGRGECFRGDGTTPIA